jgi:hypothetical protein
MVRYRRHRWFGGLLVSGALIAVTGPAVLAQVATESASESQPVPEFQVIWTGLLSTSQMPADDSQQLSLRRRGISTIVNLDEAMFDVGRYGFESFLWVALPAGTAPTQAQAERFLRFIQQPDNQPAHISGSLREARATLVALLRYAVDGMPLENALAEGQRLNLGAALPLQHVEWLRSWAATRPPGSHRRPPRP